MDKRTAAIETRVRVTLQAYREAETHWHYPKVTLKGVGRFIVEYEPDGGWRDDEDQLRFSRLIAQAPAMLAWLREFGAAGPNPHDDYCARNTHGDEECSCATGKARALLRAVEEETS